MLTKGSGILCRDNLAYGPKAVSSGIYRRGKEVSSGKEIENA
jgi:hypothetical protein